MAIKEPQTFTPTSRSDWRNWLKDNHEKEQSVSLIYYKAKTGKSSLTWSDAVDEALCFGWIDSTRRPVDEEKFMQFFTRRKPKSTWSKINKDKVEQLEKDGLMSAAGRVCIEIAKQNGSWNILDTVDNLEIPDALEAAFKSKPGSKQFFLGLSKSVKKAMLHRMVMAKQEETKQKRVNEIMETIGQGLKGK